METLNQLDNLDITDTDHSANYQEDYEYQKLETANSTIDPEYNFIGVHSITFTQSDMILIIFLTFISYWTRNFMIQYPDKVVFDEFHFGGFTNHYIKGENFDDIHPPLGKLILYLFAKVNQYSGNIDFKQKDSFDNVDYIGIRQCPALFASFCSPIIYIALRCFGFSLLSSFTAAFMIICENSMIVEGRFILTDGILHFFTCLAVMTTGIVLTQNPYSFSWWLSMVFNGISVGCAVSTKLTSLSLCPFVGLVHFVQVLEIHQKTVIKMKSFFERQFWLDVLIRALTLIFFIIIVFFLSFCAHFALLPYKGESASWLGKSYQNSLLDRNSPKQKLSVRFRNQSLIKNTVLLNVQMHKLNMHVTSDHPYASKWYSWPFLTGKWVLFFTEGPKHIMCQGQIFNVYCGTLSILFIAGFAFFAFVTNKVCHEIKINLCVPAIFAFGYCSSFFPFALIKRAMFFYHYIIPIIFGILTFASSVDNLLINHQVIKAVVLCWAQILTFIAFFFWAPWTYGMPMEDFDIRLWNKKWQM